MIRRIRDVCILPCERITSVLRRWTNRFALVIVVAGFIIGTDSPCLADPEETNPGASALDPNYAAAKLALERKDWKDAARLLSKAALRDPENADLQNYLGYSYRHLKQFELAFKHYKRALALNPRHRGAHEYIGEAYLIIGDLKSAEKHLAALREICLLPCEELSDLERAIAKHRAKASPRRSR
jgi:tetratricopeptide (TPR) repeat protein